MYEYAYIHTCRHIAYIVYITQQTCIQTYREGEKEIEDFSG